MISYLYIELVSVYFVKYARDSIRFGWIIGIHDNALLRISLKHIKGLLLILDFLFAA